MLSGFRCFMDQLHEELKEVTPPPPDILFQNIAGELLMALC